jgi:hypothetical protein
MVFFVKLWLAEICLALNLEENAEFNTQNSDFAVNSYNGVFQTIHVSPINPFQNYISEYGITFQLHLSVSYDGRMEK